MYPTLLAVPGSSLTFEQSESLDMLLSISKTRLEIDELGKTVPEGFDDPIMQIMRRRLAVAYYSMSPALNCFLADLCQGIPGRAVMWAYTVAVWCHKNKTIGMTLHDWVEEYPDCVPDDKEYDRCWDGQKVTGCNGLDFSVAWTFEGEQNASAA